MGRIFGDGVQQKSKTKTHKHKKWEGSESLWRVAPHRYMEYNYTICTFIQTVVCLAKGPQLSQSEFSTD